MNKIMNNTDSKNAKWYQSRFELFEKGLNGESKSWLHATRREAIARFAEIGFPTTRNEEWRFTNVAPIAKVDFTPVVTADDHGLTQKDVEQYELEGTDAHMLVFLDGHFSPTLSRIQSLPRGAKLGGLADATKSGDELVIKHLARHAQVDGNAFTALSTAFLRDGAFVVIPDGTTLDRPIHLLFVTTGRVEQSAIQPRNLIVVGKNSRVSLVEQYVTAKKNLYLTNVVSEIIVDEDAVVEHDKLQEESESAFHVSTIHVVLGGRSNFTSNSIAFGGDLVRNNVIAVFKGESAECTLNGLSLATGKQHIDNHTTIDHAQPRCVSHELYKSILDGRAKGVFNGKIFVRKDAQKTDARQTNKTLLLSDEATIDTKPQLEIFADDVKCTHGATVGQLDEEQVFYLRARGIGLEQARDILTFAFASDVIGRIHVKPLREQLDRMLQSRLQRGRQTENAQ